MPDTYSTIGPQCPYCDTVITPDEPGYYDEGKYTEDTCVACGKQFKVEVSHTTSWSCEEIEGEEDAGPADG